VIVRATLGWPRDDLGNDVAAVADPAPQMSVLERLLTPLTDEEWLQVKAALDAMPKADPVPEPPRVMRLHPRWG
jgi:hypothetical protein